MRASQVRRLLIVVFLAVQIAGPLAPASPVLAADHLAALAGQCKDTTCS